MKVFRAVEKWSTFYCNLNHTITNQKIIVGNSLYFTIYGLDIEDYAFSHTQWIKVTFICLFNREKTQPQSCTKGNYSLLLW